MVAYLLAALTFGAAPQSQAAARTPPPPQSMCGQALAAGTGPASSELCLGEAQRQQALALSDANARRRLLGEAVEHFRRAATLSAETDLKVAAFEALSMIYAPAGLDEYDQYESVLREIIGLKPGEL